MVGLSAATSDSEKAVGLFALVSEGSATHPFVRFLRTLDGATATRNATDAVHHLCMLHGRAPSVFDHAAARTVDEDARRVMFVLADNFATERELLAQMVVAAGPIPSTPGQAETQASVIAQRHAIEMLAQSDRQGCAVGAGLALALDWQAIRPVIDAAARRFGVVANPLTFPPPNDIAAFARSAAPVPAIERALLFGAQQIVTQHRGLWDLLEARAEARAHS